MDVKTTLQPGDKGTKQLVRKYGQKLITVRYRYDKAKKMRYKTVELIEAAEPWNPILNFHPDKQVPIRIDYAEITVREKVKTNGGYWNQKKKCWLLSYQAVLRLKLESRMIID